MSQSYPGFPAAIAGFLRRFIFDSISRVFLGTLFGLPALVIAVSVSFYVPQIPEYFAGFAIISLLGIIVKQVSDSIDQSHNGIDFDDTELNQSQLRVFVIMLTVVTVSWVSSIILVGGSIGAVFLALSNVGYLAALFAAMYPIFDSWMWKRHPRLSIGRLAVEGSFRMCKYYLNLRYGPGAEVDHEVEQSARRSGPII